MADQKNIVWITGATSGIGEALARQCPWRDTEIISVSRRRHPDFETVPFDLTDMSSWDAVGAHLRAQEAAGADLVQLFDSWVGNLSVDEYRVHVMPYTARILGSLRGPSIHFGTQTAHLLELIRDAGGTCVGVDHRIALDEAWERLGHDVPVQGNLDPALLLGPVDRLLTQVDDVLRRAAHRPGHLFNLGHGILPETPMEHVQAVIDHVHSRTRR